VPSLGELSFDLRILFLFVKASAPEFLIEVCIFYQTEMFFWIGSDVSTLLVYVSYSVLIASVGVSVVEHTGGG
jgi:hypothetical protein